jgi:hypothetical protein
MRLAGGWLYKRQATGDSGSSRDTGLVPLEHQIQPL